MTWLHPALKGAALIAGLVLIALIAHEIMRAIGLAGIERRADLDD